MSAEKKAEQLHTPGPWTVLSPQGPMVNADERGDVAIITDYEPTTIIAEVIHHRNQRGNKNGIRVDTRPDAHLIAAAPELLAALKRLESRHAPRLNNLAGATECPCDDCAFVRAAIAKAEGK